MHYLLAYTTKQKHTKLIICVFALAITQSNNYKKINIIKKVILYNHNNSWSILLIFNYNFEFLNLHDVKFF